MSRVQQVLHLTFNKILKTPLPGVYESTKMKSLDIYFDSEKIKMWSESRSPILFLTVRSSLIGSELGMLMKVSKRTITQTKKKFGQAFLIIDCSLVKETCHLLIFLQESLIIHSKAGVQLQAVISPTS